MANYYALLNLQPAATPAEIKTAYARERARLLADKPENDETLTEPLKALDEAYATLVDPNRRAAYDRALSAETGSKELALVTHPAALAVPQAPAVPLPQQACPHCGTPNPIQATTCSACGGQITRPCPHCGQPVILNQTVCPRCATFIPEYDVRRFAEGIAAGQRVQNERRDSEVRVTALEAGHRAGARLGVVFWTIVAFLCIALVILAVVLYGYFARLYR